MFKVLKVIVFYVVVNLIIGFFYENNIVLIGNFEWFIYVVSNLIFDDSVYSDW